MSINTRNKRPLAVVRLIGYLSIFAFPVSFFANKPDSVSDGLVLGFILAISFFGPMVTLALTRSVLSRRDHFREFPDNTISPLEWNDEKKFRGPNGSVETLDQFAGEWPHSSPV